MKFIFSMIVESVCYSFFVFYLQEYYKLLDSADEKVQIANQVYDTVSTENIISLLRPKC